VTTLLLLRHAQSTWNASGRIQGWADPPLTETGRAAARALAGRLAHAVGLPPTVDGHPEPSGPTGGSPQWRLVASDLRRARETAAILAADIGGGNRSRPLVRIEPRLRERGAGALEGRTRPEAEASWPGAVGALLGCHDPVPDGEPAAVFTARVTDALVSLAAEVDGNGRALLVVTHGGVLRALERASGGEPERTENLGGRWFEADAAGGLRPGKAFTPG
jgi:probable phosphoglycerate mutase